MSSVKLWSRSKKALIAFVVAHQRTTVLATVPRKCLVKKEARSHLEGSTMCLVPFKVATGCLLTHHFSRGACHSLPIYLKKQKDKNGINRNLLVLVRHGAREQWRSPSDCVPVPLVTDLAISPQSWRELWLWCLWRSLHSQEGRLFFS